MTQMNKHLYVTSLEEPKKDWKFPDVDWVKPKNISKAAQRIGSVYFAYASEKTLDKEIIFHIEKHKEQTKLFLVYYEGENLNFFIHQLAEQATKSTIRKTIAFNSFSVMQRIIHAWKIGAEKDLIANAYHIDSKIVVIDCASNKLEVPIAKLPELAKRKVDASQFEVDSDGSFIYWPEIDFHIDLDGLRVRIDEKYSEQVLRRDLPKSKWYGSALRKVRESKALSQNEIEGVSERQIRRIENGEFTPTIDTLRKLSSAHRMSLNEYLNEVANAYQEIVASGK